MTFPIIGIAGKAGAGKDTAADFITQNYGFKRVALADPMKRFYRELTGAPVDELWGGSSGRVNHRVALQHLGTEWGRNCVGESTWVDYCFRVVDHIARGLDYHPFDGMGSGQSRVPCFGVVIPDIRFYNEAGAILARGGRVLHLRGSHLPIDSDHASEQAQWDRYVSTAAEHFTSLGPCTSRVSMKAAIGQLMSIWGIGLA